MSIPSYESPNGDDIEAPCKWCGADYADHDYEQQARWCWPVRAEHWEKLAFRLNAALNPISRCGFCAGPHKYEDCPDYGKTTEQLVAEAFQHD